MCNSTPPTPPSEDQARAAAEDVLTEVQPLDSRLAWVLPALTEANWSPEGAYVSLEDGEPYVERVDVRGEYVLVDESAYDESLYAIIQLRVEFPSTNSDLFELYVIEVPSGATVRVGDGKLGDALPDPKEAHRLLWES